MLNNRLILRIVLFLKALSEIIYKSYQADLFAKHVLNLRQLLATIFSNYPFPDLK